MTPSLPEYRHKHYQYKNTDIDTTITRIKTLTLSYDFKSRGIPKLEYINCKQKSGIKMPKLKSFYNSLITITLEVTVVAV